MPSRLTRRTLGYAALAGLAARGAAAAPCPAPPQVLFVCPAGTVKSAIAREALRTRAAKAGVAVDVRSRGLQPEDHMTPELAARLAAAGLDPAAEPARPLTAADVATADVVVAFDEAGDDPRLAGARKWTTPSWLRAYDAAKADLDTRMDGLVAELAARRPCPA